MERTQPRTWTIGDPEPDDHPNVTADGDEHMPGPWHYQWEPPSEDNWQRGGWWSVEYGGDLWDWTDILGENMTLTEDLTQEGDRGHVR